MAQPISPVSTFRLPGTKRPPHLHEARRENLIDDLMSRSILETSKKNETSFLPHKSPNQIPKAKGRGPANHLGPVPSLLLNTSTHIFPNLKSNHQPLITAHDQSGGNLGPHEKQQRNSAQSPYHSSLIAKARADRQGKGRKPTRPEMDPVIYACCTDNIRQKKKKKAKKKLHIILPRMLAAVYIPRQCLSTGELFAIRWGKGREGMKSAKENMFLKARVLYNRMFSSRCLLF